MGVTLGDSAWLCSPVEIRHLRYFCAVANALNFTRAAEKMHVAQSALSRQIRDLEGEMGVTLLIRNTSRVQLTDAGRQFHEAAEKLLTQLAIAVTTAQAVGSGRTGDLRIASDWRISINIIPETVRTFRHRYPKIAVDYIDIPITHQLDAIRKREVHIGFLANLSLQPASDLALYQFATLQLSAVLPVSHPLAGRSQIGLKDLASERWLRLEDGPNDDGRRFMMQILESRDVIPRMGRTADSVTGILSLVAAGEGVALLPPEVIPNGFEGLVAVPNDCPPLSLYAVWLKASGSPQVDRFVEILRQHASREAERRKEARHKRPSPQAVITRQTDSEKRPAKSGR